MTPRETQKGDWWAVMLGKRFIDGYTLLARETFLTPVKFEGQRPVFNPGIGIIQPEQKRPDLPWSPFPKKPAKDEFNADKLDLEWNLANLIRLHKIKILGCNLCVKNI